jgi:tetratricopeptide (TPR) repeat protein
VLLRATERPLAHAPSWNNLRGYAEFKLHNHKPALHYLQRALQLDPDNEDYLLDIGEFLGSNSAHEEAARIFEVAARRIPHSHRVQFGLAVSLVLLNRRAEAQALLETLVRIHPWFDAAYKVLGECYEDAGDADAMVALGKTLQAVSPSNPAGWYLEGAGLLREGRADVDRAVLDAAIAALQRSIALDPSNSRAHFALGRAWQQQGDDARAIAAWKQVLQIDADHERAHYVLGQLYQRKGDAEGAKRELAAHKQIKERDRNAQYRRLLITMRDDGGSRSTR